MKQYRIINDWHLYGVNPVGTLDELSYAIDSSPFPVYLNGDIVDIANAKYKDLPQAYQVLLLLIAKVKKKNGSFIRGNHCCNIVNEPDEVLVDGKILIAHGDIPMWGEEKSAKYRNQKRGAGWFKRNIVAELVDELRRFWTVRPNERLKAWAREAKKRYPQLKYLILGHSHPPKIVQALEDGVVLMILPRGVNDLNLVV